MTTSKMPRAGTPARHLYDALGGFHASGPLTTTQRLEAIRELRARLDEEEQQLAFRERLAGSSWQKIADLWGIGTRQGARWRFEASAGLLDHLDDAQGRPARP